MRRLRIISLLPSATEIVAALGLQDCLVGRSHECDFPAGVERLPVCSRPRIQTGGTSRDIDARVRDVVDQGLSMYLVDPQLLEQLRPDVILAQTQCAVCAVTPGDVDRALCVWPSHLQPPRTLSLEPADLGGVWASILDVGIALGVAETALRLVHELLDRVQRLRDATRALPHPTVVNIEWSAPLIVAGNWMPEVIDVAGGQSLLGETGKHSPCVSWDTLARADPDVILVTPCGFRIEQTRSDLAELNRTPAWRHLRAVRHGAVYLVDGNAYFNRPGPRLVDSAEIIAEILHPDAFNFGHEGTGWVCAFDSAPVAV